METNDGINKISLPQDFRDEMMGLLGEVEFRQFELAMAKQSPVSVRRNFHCGIESITDGVAWCESGVYLSERPSFTMDPMFHGGAYYVQEASSMFIDHLVRTYIGDDPVIALDLCAAPGGKSTLLMNALPCGSLLVANEINHKRSNILAENVSKWINGWGKVENSEKTGGGARGCECIVTNNESRDFRKLGEGVFDFILCDVPCSGEGMFRKDGRSIEEWSLKNVEMCWKRQRNILMDIWDSLKDGGLMIYSTCTYNTKEDEENVRWICDELGAEVLDCKVKDEWGIIGNLLSDADFSCCHFMPHRVNGEGFFCAVMRKSGTSDSRNLRSSELREKIERHLHVIPLEVCDSEAPVYDLGYDDAIRYLRGEALKLDDNAPLGMLAVAYRGYRLGMVKNIGNRANNLYPKEWRIRKTSFACS